MGIKIKRTLDGFIVSQLHYVDNILRKFDKYDFGIVRAPVDVTLYFFMNKAKNVSQV